MAYELPLTVRVTSASDGRGRPLDALIADWAAANPKVRRVWVAGGSGDPLLVALELQPVGDSDETGAIWIAHAGPWRGELSRVTRRPVELQCIDAGVSRGNASAADTLVYERFG